MAERAADGDPRPLVSWIWRGYLKRHLPVILAALVLMTLEGGMLGALSYMIEPMFDEVFAYASLVLGHAEWLTPSLDVI